MTGSSETPDAQPPGLDQQMTARTVPGSFRTSPRLGGLHGRLPPSRRRPRREDVVTYRVRIDLTGTKPPLWRRLELVSDLFLDHAHEVLQAAFGWHNQHLHQFSCGPDRTSWQTEYYLFPEAARAGLPGIPEQNVRLDEVLVDAGDQLFYDYGDEDEWPFTIKLEAVLPRRETAPRAVCVAGRRDSPPEDCGGVDGYERVCAAADPASLDYGTAVSELAGDFAGAEGTAGLRITPFDIGAINAALASLSLDGGSRPAGPAGGLAEAAAISRGPLAGLVARFYPSFVREELEYLITSASLDQPVLIDAKTAARMVRPYAWLLDRVGDVGIKLTVAGYLPPPVVAAAMADLDLVDGWADDGATREASSPVLGLRQSAVRVGLLRKRHGRLLPVSRAQALRADPVALWWYLAERTPPASRDTGGDKAGLILLAALAAGVPGDPGEIMARLLTAMGWTLINRAGLTARAARRMARETDVVLRHMGAFSSGRYAPHAADLLPEGASFVRAALRSWPTP